MEAVITVVLSQSEADFIHRLVLDGMAPTTAATASGWAVSSARHKLAQPHIQSAIRAIHANAAHLVQRFDAQGEKAGRSARA